MGNGNLKQLHEADPKSGEAARATYVSMFSDLLRSVTWQFSQSPKNMVIVNVTTVNF